MLRKFFAMVLCCVMLCMGAGFAETVAVSEDDAMIQQAIEALKAEWTVLLGETETDGYLSIRNTRVIRLSDNDEEFFDGMEFIVEFMLYSDYFGTSPYYVDVGISDTVVFYEDGHCEVPRMDTFDQYRARYYVVDFSPFIETIIDYYDTCNAEFWLLADE